MYDTGKFVSVRGTVVRVSSIKPLCLQMAYECNNCGAVQVRQRIEKRGRERDCYIKSTMSVNDKAIVPDNLPVIIN